MTPLAIRTPEAWVDTVLADFDAFLVDHAACERKASATGMAFVVRYPDRPTLLKPMIAFALEELEHFQRVVDLCVARGLTLGADTKDPYVEPLIRWVRSKGEARLLDRLLVGAVVEARGCERFAMLADALPEGADKALYVDLTKSEARHRALFYRLARELFDADLVNARLAELVALEAEVVTGLPLRPALH